ncbi:hypothetical protein [Pseudomonas sp. C2B4]|uniref:hypothetical protein n=1 Tax=Pseudomonas sp. C2B4 TaxID=2735270 RepID=UPI0015862A5D|nr:hypothetical protein [Pseudomonas sp. C2B4]NUU36926.1 hypothetical protein [Pseudomonas sp. C2B4]
MEQRQQIALIWGFTSGSVSTLQIPMSRSQRYGIEFISLAPFTVMLVRHGNKALEQDFHANQRIDLGNVAAGCARPEPQQLSGNCARFEASDLESAPLMLFNYK